ncbi:2Fe-2S iron-sulfur cluster-binding protein [Roseibium litorale]|uniref:2Fe-2S iron-sulfur cluster binding domain-containing protein n=1 Tax=Roseibium litorale TaxID=2803841 RepID=A0ABR9CIQ2_9HYPH|nr:2Fe-2S iron-sulfur cluster-binding protein [Roseibium litorale]MBD8890708.1 2Fe-2S iron-sulfur cluster binding domain-containing protein [Roseibium litorale]
MPKLIFIEADGTRTEVDAQIGKSVMETARDGNVAGVVADCGGSLACATCHCYFSEDQMAALPSKSDTEADMLDFANAEVKDGSRLSCQIIVTEDMDGWEIRVPDTQ